MFNQGKIRNKMKKSISILRIVALILIGGIGTVLLFGEEQDQDLVPFVLHCLFDKVAGLFLLALTASLIMRWSKSDAFFLRINKWCEDCD